MKMVNYVLYQEAAGDWSIHALEYPVATCGDTKEEALKMFQEAIDLYFEDETYEEVQVQHPEVGHLLFHA